MLNSVGSILWIAARVGAGMLFRTEVNRVLEQLEILGRASLVVIGALLASKPCLRCRAHGILGLKQSQFPIQMDPNP